MKVITDHHFPTLLRQSAAGLLLLTLLAEPGTGYPVSAADSLTVHNTESAGWPELYHYLELAILRNPELQALNERYRSEGEFVRETGLLPDPEITIAYDFNPMMANSTLGRFSLSAMQMIPWFGTLESRRELQRSGVAATRSRMDTRLLDILEELQLQWLSIAEIRAEIQIYKKSLNRLATLESSALARYESGRGTQADLLRLQMEVERYRSGLADREDRLEPLRAAFNEQLDRDPGAEVATPDSFSRKPFPHDREEIERIARLQNPLYDEIDAKRDVAISQQRLAVMEGRPGIGLGLEVMGRDFGPMAMFPDARESVIGMATVRVPLFRSRTRSQIRRAELEVRALEFERTRTDNRISTAAEEALEELRRSERSLNLLEQELIPRAEQAAVILAEEFAGGRSTFDEVIRIERELLELQLERIRSLIEQNRAVLRLDRIMADSYVPLLQQSRDFEMNSRSHNR